MFGTSGRRGAVICFGNPGGKRCLVLQVGKERKGKGREGNMPIRPEYADFFWTSLLLSYLLSCKLASACLLQGAGFHKKMLNHLRLNNKN